MNATQRKRLLQLGDFIVEKVPAKKFYMGAFGAYGYLTIDPKICGTAACALGWATVLFRKLGVHMGVTAPAYKRKRGFGIGEPLFGLTLDQSYKLFTGSKLDRSAKQIRGDIRRLVRKLDKAK